MSWLRGAFGSNGSRSKGPGRAGTVGVYYAAAMQAERDRLSAEVEKLSAELDRVAIALNSHGVPACPSLREAIDWLAARDHDEVERVRAEHSDRRRRAEPDGCGGFRWEAADLGVANDALREALRYFAIDDSAFSDTVLSVAVTREHAAKLRALCDPNGGVQ